MTRVVDVAFEEVGQSPFEQGDPNRENTSDIFFFAVTNHDPANSSICLNFLGKVLVDLSLLALNDFGAQCYERSICLLQSLTDENSPEIQTGCETMVANRRKLFGFYNTVLM